MQRYIVEIPIGISLLHTFYMYVLFIRITQSNNAIIILGTKVPTTFYTKQFGVK